MAAGGAGAKGTRRVGAASPRDSTAATSSLFASPALFASSVGSSEASPVPTHPPLRPGRGPLLRTPSLGSPPQLSASQRLTPPPLENSGGAPLQNGGPLQTGGVVLYPEGAPLLPGGVPLKAGGSGGRVKPEIGSQPVARLLARSTADLDEAARRCAIKMYVYLHLFMYVWYMCIYMYTHIRRTAGRRLRRPLGSRRRLPPQAPRYIQGSSP